MTFRSTLLASSQSLVALPVKLRAILNDPQKLKVFISKIVKGVKKAGLMGLFDSQGFTIGE